MQNGISSFAPPLYSIPASIGSAWGSKPENADKVEAFSYKFNEVVFRFLGFDTQRNTSLPQYPK